MKTNRTFDIVIYGASGYTGGLVAKHLWNKYGRHQSFKLAIAGRDCEKLQSVKAALHAGDDLGILIADAQDLGSLTTIANNTRLIITTVGPYQFHGAKLVEACASAGTTSHQPRTVAAEPANRSGLRSIPSSDRSP